MRARKRTLRTHQCAWADMVGHAGGGDRGDAGEGLYSHKSSISQILQVYNKCNGALTFENFCQDGYKTAQELSEAGVPAEILHDVAVGFVMQEADIVLTGAETLNPKPDPRNPKP